jgi:VIT1/CCC1 family predicted Fe2+/Mn2+ transporter
MSIRLNRKLHAKLPVDKELFLSAYGGLESGVATTTAIIIGLLISGGSSAFIAIAAYISVSVQAFNSASARYVGLRTSMEIDDLRADNRREPLLNAIVQFVSHVFASSMPILPLFFFTDRVMIATASITLSAVTLLAAGLLQGNYLKLQAKQNIQEIMVISALVVLVGSLAGLVLR